MVGETSDSHPDAAVQYIYTENSYEPLARVDSHGEHADIFWYHTELNGLPDSVTDSSGDTVWRGASTAWGRSLRESTPVTWDTPQNLRFQGQYLDRETGLHYNTFRYYDPAGGCYTQMDPIGLAGGLNTYTYVVDPLVYVDVLGLSCTVIKAKSRTDALRKARQHAQVPRISRGGENIAMDDLNSTSRGTKWNVMKKDKAQSLGRRNPNGKNYWFEHPDGHPDAGKPGVPEHHSSGHIHATDPKGNEVVFTW
ncbi:RHS repeat-associated core domain-containing protein [Kosakonia sp. CCTCC M2018092]|uniref:RHS repeat-associated core domain-containing protein n=1 Tax=Kosakonia sp. CCTCC M2018092 TaxID=2492396 RepID=UPI0035137F09